jgi:hypothetical protein
MTNDEIIKEEIDSILEDIKKLYKSSGRKASGKFEEELEAVYEPNKGTIKGVTYLSGRGKTKNGHIEGTKYLSESILDWLNAKSIRPRNDDISLKSLAFLIARKIHKEGTQRSRWLNVYELVITPQRINKIIDRVSQLNVNRLITEIVVELEILAKNV